MATIAGGCSNTNGLTDSGRIVLEDIRYLRETVLDDGGGSDTGNEDRVVMDNGTDTVDPPDVVMDVPTDIPVDSPDVVTDPNVRYRFINVMSMNGSDPPPAIDYCLRPSNQSGMAFTGPILETNGRAAGLDWNQAGAYITTAAGTYDVLLVAANATDCNSPLTPAITNLDLTGAGAFRTVVVMGRIPLPDAGTSAYSVRLLRLVDRNPATAATSPPALRLIHALPAPLRFDVGLITDPQDPAGSFLPIWENVGFGELAAGGSFSMSQFDSNNYYNGAPAAGLSVGARMAGSTGVPILSLNGVDIVDHTFTTSILTTVPRPAMLPAQGAMFCIDNAPPIDGLSQCVARAP